MQHDADFLEAEDFQRTVKNDLTLADGDAIEPIVKTGSALRLQVEFQTQHRSVEEVVITRSPASQTGG